MELKKKLQYFLKNHGIVSNMVILFMLVLGLQMIFSPISYARTTLTDDEAEYLFSQCCYSSGDFYASNTANFSSSSSPSSKSTLDSSLLSTFKNYFDSNNTLEIDSNKTLFIVVQSGLWCYVYYGNFNNGKNDTLPHLNLSYRSYTSTNNRASCYFQAINDNKTAIQYTIKRFMFNKSTLSQLTNISITDYTMNPLSFSGYEFFPDLNYNSSNFQAGNNVLVPFQGLVSFSPTNSIYSNMIGSFNFGTADSVFIPYLYGVNLDPIPDIPDEPSGETGNTGTITNPSGEVTGNIDLSGIENSLNNIENKIPTSGEIGNILSGETNRIIGTLTDNPDLSNTNITSGDITDALDFEFASDPYANFWLELTNGLKNALLGTKRTIDITFQSRTWTINLDDFAVLPAWLAIIVTPFSTVFFVWILVRWWKVILDKITSGNVDSILKENSEERNFKFVLGGYDHMIETIFNFILNAFFWLVGLIGSIVIYPIQAILVTLIPSIGDYLSIFLGFMRESLFPMISFAKELFLEITCCPRPLFVILITTLFARWAIAPAIRSILLIVNVWKIKSGGKTQ